MIAPAAQPQDGLQWVASVTEPSGVKSEYPWACGAGTTLSVGRDVLVGFSGVNTWSWRKSPRVCPLTFSTSMPSRMVLVLLYCHSASGLKLGGWLKAMSRS